MVPLLKELFNLCNKTGPMKVGKTDFNATLQQVHNQWLNVTSLGRRYVLKSSSGGGCWKLECLSVDGPTVALYSTALTFDQANKKVPFLSLLTLYFCTCGCLLRHFFTKHFSEHSASAFCILYYVFWLLRLSCGLYLACW